MAQDTLLDMLAKPPVDDEWLKKRPWVNIPREVQDPEEEYDPLAVGTIFSQTVEDPHRPGKFVLLPSITHMPDGSVSFDEKDMMLHYINTGEHLGKFDTIKDAGRYANKISHEQGAQSEDRAFHKDFRMPYYRPFDPNKQ